MPAPRRAHVTLGRALDVAAQQFEYREDFDPDDDDDRSASRILNMLHTLFGGVDERPYWRARQWYVEELRSRMTSLYDCEYCEDDGCGECDEEWEDDE